MLVRNKHKIRQLKADKAGDWFGCGSVLYNDKTEIKNGKFIGEVRKWEDNVP